MLNNIYNIFFIPEIFLACSSFVCLLFGLFLKKNAFRQTSNLAVFVLLLTILLVYNESESNFANYKNLFKQINEIIYLSANNFKMLQKWRIKQEKTLWLKSKNKRNLRIMNRDDIINFMQTYQRITQSMFKDAPKYASIVMKLNSNHQINSIKFR